MITSDGKTIIAKYLLNQAPEFVSHIAVGVGDNALYTTSPASASYVSSAKSLDFEAFRVPVIAKGLIKEDGVEKLLFKAELPTEQLYRVTELALYPAGYDTLAGKFGSKTFISFTNSEPWNYVIGGNASAATYLNKPLQVSDISGLTTGGIVANDSIPVFFANSNDPVFDYVNRRARREPLRYLNKSLAVQGNFSGSATYTTSYIENSSVSLDLEKNSPNDQIKLALSLVNKSYDDDSLPTSVDVKLELVNNADTRKVAYVELNITSSELDDLEMPSRQKRYIVITKSLSEFTADTDFSWKNINQIRIYAKVNSTTPAPSEFFIFFDGIRLENISSNNSLYKMIGAEYIKTIDGEPVRKEEHSTTFIEYRFGLGVE